MAEEIACENGRISNFQGFVTLTLGRVTLYTVVHHLSTSTYMPNFIEIEETFYGRTYVRPQNISTISMKFGVWVEVDKWWTDSHLR